MFRKITSTLIAVAITSASGSLLASSQADYEKALAGARTGQKAAQAVGGEWRDTDKLLQQADAAAKEGDFRVAAELAAKAAFQSKMGQQQAKSQANAGNPDYLY